MTGRERCDTILQLIDQVLADQDLVAGAHSNQVDVVDSNAAPEERQLSLR